MRLIEQILSPIYYLGIIGSGCVIVGGNPSYTPFELAGLFNKCNVKLVLTEPKLLSKVQEAASTSSNPKIYSLGDSSWDSLTQHGERDWIRLSEDQAKTEISMYLSTSGTTGAPKFAAVSHTYLTATAANIEKESATKDYQISRLIALPIMHAFAAPLVIAVAFRTGVPTYLLSRFDADDFLDAVDRFQITDVPVVPSIMSMLVQNTNMTGRQMASLREVLSAGAVLSSDVKAQFQLVAPNSKILSLYGQTEVGWICSTPFNRRVESEGLPSLGVPLTGYTIDIWDADTGEMITEPGVRGEILIDGPALFLYYLNDPKATENSFTMINGRRYLRSGDIGYRDTYDDLYIIDRLKDLIKVRGWQVSPAEVEGVIVQYPGIEDAAVVGTKDIHGHSGEIPVAFIVGVVDLISLKAYVAERLAAYKRPVEYKFISKIPRNPAGKILRRLLLEELDAAVVPVLASPVAMKIEIDTSNVVPEKVEVDNLNIAAEKLEVTSQMSSGRRSNMMSGCFGWLKAKWNLHRNKTELI